MILIAAAFFFGHVIAVDAGHPINCVTNPEQVVCEYKVNQ